MNKTPIYSQLSALAGSRPLVRQMIKFGLVGVLNTTIDFSVYFLLTRFTPFFADHRIAANTIAFVVAVSNSFFLNKHWTFREKTQTAVAQYPKFFFVSFGGLLLTQGIFFALHTIAGLHDLWAKMIAVIVVMCWNFAVNKMWTFKV